MNWAAVVEKCKALAQWFYLLERVEHRHWCGYETARKNCPNRSLCRICTGIRCAGIDYLDCADCIAATKKAERSKALQ